MCGIAGIRSFDFPVSISKLEKMSASIAHRGRDAHGVWVSSDNKVAFAHRRLSIIDLSEMANQPFIYKHIAITFNGEIYNYLENKEILIKKGYRFTTNSDTEIVCALYLEYGENMFVHMDGAFAFAIWDEKKQLMLVARDRFGEKPLYYAQKDNSFYFASEMKALWSAGIEKTPDPLMFYNYLAYDVLENPIDKEQTFYLGIKKLKASHYLLIEGNTISIKPYWKLKIKQHSITIDKASETLFSLLETSIKRRLRSDVNIGTSFSGGLDSSIIVELISRFLPTEKQNVFSARFKNYLYDETKYQEILLNGKNFKSYVVYPTVNDFIKNLFILFDIQEEPFGSGSVFSQWSVMKTAKENNVKVMLDGQGADEVFGGYVKYANTYLIELLRKMSVDFFTQQKKICENELSNNKALIKNVKDAFIRKNLSFLRPLYYNFRNKSKDLGINTQFAGQFYKKTPPFKIFVDLNKQLNYDTTTYGLEKLLRIADRNSMYHGVEVRLPYLYHELVEFVFSLPSTFKIHNGYSKYILRNMANDLLPYEIVWRKQKIGYNTPIENWVKNNEFVEMFHDAENRLIKNGIIVSNHTINPMKIVETDYFMR